MTSAIMVESAPPQVSAAAVDDAVTDESDVETNAIPEGAAGKGAAAGKDTTTFSSAFHQVREHGLDQPVHTTPCKNSRCLGCFSGDL